MGSMGSAAAVWHQEKYPQLPNKIINLLLPFPDTYLCDARFSIKTTDHSNLTEE